MSDYDAEPLPEPEPVVSEAVSSEAEEEPVPVEEEEEPEEEPAPVEEDPAEESVPVEQVASEIREILTPVESANEVEASSVLTSNDNLCSLKTLVDVLGKWSGDEIRRGNVEDLLKEGTDVDEDLDDLEKVVEVLQLWIREGGSTFREHNHLKNLDENT